MMRKFVMKDDKIRDSKHEKHGERFTSFAIKALQKRIQQAKKEREIINKSICKRQIIHNIAQKRAKKSCKIRKKLSIFVDKFRERDIWFFPEDKKSQNGSQLLECGDHIQTSKNSHQVSWNYRQKKMFL